ncbi:MAG: hypothetical protein RMN24_10675 [Anaerolineae bacterium]|nr:hypothetical protein [Caldilineales bacterium]MCX7851208.1 hypothetical protein [Caldilineales bacterium]MDW8269617.1 hypothetical protein [Anaerolineae bacterium]
MEPRKLSFRLTQEAYSRYPGIIGLGTLLDVVIQSDPLLAAAYDDPTGWYVRQPESHPPTLTALGLDHYAFSGAVLDRHVELNDLQLVYQVLLDCGLPISLWLHDPAARPGEGYLGEHTPDPGACLQGVAHLHLGWGDDEAAPPMAQVLNAVVVGIDRLILRSGPGFGTFRSESTLSNKIFNPDQIYLTLRFFNY